MLWIPGIILGSGHPQSFWRQGGATPVEIQCCEAEKLLDVNLSLDMQVLPPVLDGRSVLSVKQSLPMPFEGPPEGM